MGESGVIEAVGRDEVGAGHGVILSLVIHPPDECFSTVVNDNDDL